MAGKTLPTDMTGKKYNALTALYRDGTWPGGKLAAWRFRCECGTEKTLCGSAVRLGQIKSCGCWHHGVVKHGMAKTKAYATWCTMRARCTNPKVSCYRNYGGRGITVCERWQKFENFFADMGLPPEGMSLDRIDNSKGYSPENCRWATKKQQANNTRTNVKIKTSRGEFSMEEIASIAGINYQSVQYRRKAGYQGDEFLAPHQRRRKSTT